MSLSDWNISKLRRSCICGKPLAYLNCCGRYSKLDEVELGTTSPVSMLRTPSKIRYLQFRKALHDLYASLFSLEKSFSTFRNSLDGYPHQLLSSDPDYMRGLHEAFLWHYSPRYGDHSPIQLMAVHMLGENAYLSGTFETWSNVPLWAYQVDMVDSAGIQVTAVGTQRRHLLHSLGIHVPLKKGDGILCRILPFQGHEYSGMAQLHFSGEKGWEFLKTRFLNACYELDISPGFELSPSRNFDSWKDSTTRFIKIWRNFTYDSVVGVPRRNKTKPARMEWSCEDPWIIMQAMIKTEGFRQLTPRKAQLLHASLIVADIELFQSVLIVHLKDEAFMEYCEAKLNSVFSFAEANQDRFPSKEFNSAISL